MDRLPRRDGFCVVDLDFPSHGDSECVYDAARVTTASVRRSAELGGNDLKALAPFLRNGGRPEGSKPSDRLPHLCS
jgi:hypothetical protein